ncbi:MAG: HI0074 family nucleotidyltransferase substrate-binding subunit [Rubrivivax sp.]
MPPKFALDCTGLRDALQRLSDAIDVVSLDEFGRLDQRWQATLVAGVVQCFEFTYELCWRMLKRQLEQEVPTPSELDAMSFRDLVRLGHERGLVREPEAWFEFRELRNITSHTYSEPLAQRVAAGAAPLLAQGKLLLQELERRNRG